MLYTIPNDYTYIPNDDGMVLHATHTVVMLKIQWGHVARIGTHAVHAAPLVNGRVNEVHTTILIEL
jgi:hypothetical protein